MVFARAHPKIEWTILTGIHDAGVLYNSPRRKIGADEYFEYLRNGYITLKSQIRNGGMAEKLKIEIKFLWRNTNVIPSWWGWWIGELKEYDITEYDTGDPLELAEKIWMAHWYGIPQNEIMKLYDIAMFWAKEIDFSDIEALIKLARFIAILSWTDYEFDDEFYELKEKVRNVVEERYSNIHELAYIVLGDRKIVEAFNDFFLEKPWAWLSWRDNVH